jgi:hypothetical protein
VLVALSVRKKYAECACHGSTTLCGEAGCALCVGGLAATRPWGAVRGFEAMLGAAIHMLVLALCHTPTVWVLQPAGRLKSAHPESYGACVVGWLMAIVQTSCSHLCSCCGRWGGI